MTFLITTAVRIPDEKDSVVTWTSFLISAAIPVQLGFETMETLGCVE